MLVFMRLSEHYSVPEELGLLYDFLNSLDERTYVEAGTPHVPHDALAKPASLTRWLHERKLLAPRAMVTVAQHARALELREVLRDWLISGRDAKTADRANGVFEGYALKAQIRAGAMDIEPLGGGADAGLGRVLAELTTLQATGQLARLKACESPECHWIFFDRSKPANRRWCSSDQCGNRHKTRAYRDRQRA